MHLTFASLSLASLHSGIACLFKYNYDEHIVISLFSFFAWKRCCSLLKNILEVPISAPFIEVYHVVIAFLYSMFVENLFSQTIHGKLSLHSELCIY